MIRSRQPWSLPIIAAVVLATEALAAGAAPSIDRTQRFTTVFQETSGGAARPKSAAETRLVRLLLERGVTFVDESQAQKIRSVTDAGALVYGSIANAITSLDADFIIAGVSTLTPLKTDLLGKKIHRYNAIIDATVVRVDTARIVAALSARGEGMGLDPDQAAHNAASVAAGTLASRSWPRCRSRRDVSRSIFTSRASRT